MENNKLNSQEIQENLRYFFGTSQYYRYSPLFPNFLLTDGTLYVAEACEAFWLVDLIASHQINPVISKHPELQALQFWYLTVKDNKALLTCEWDKNEVVYTENIEPTNFPLSFIKIWVAKRQVEKGKYTFIAYLPSEH